MEDGGNTLKEYIKKSRLDIEQIIDEYYGYIYILIKNTKSIGIAEEDVEEIVSDVFFAMWKNYLHLSQNIKIKPYLAGIAKNMLRNRYRKTKIDYSITDYEEKLVSSHTIEKITEDREQTEMISKILKKLKSEEYQIFIKFYYENKKIKEIADELNISESKTKVILYRIRQEVKTKLKNGGYSYGKG